MSSNNDLSLKRKRISYCDDLKESKKNKINNNSFDYNDSLLCNDDEFIKNLNTYEKRVAFLYNKFKINNFNSKLCNDHGAFKGLVKELHAEQYLIKCNVPYKKNQKLRIEKNMVAEFDFIIPGAVIEVKSGNPLNNNRDDISTSNEKQIKRFFTYIPKTYIVYIYVEKSYISSFSTLCQKYDRLKVISDLSEITINENNIIHYCSNIHVLRRLFFHNMFVNSNNNNSIDLYYFSKYNINELIIPRTIVNLLFFHLTDEEINAICKKFISFIKICDDKHSDILTNDENLNTYMKRLKRVKSLFTSSGVTNTNFNLEAYENDNSVPLYFSQYNKEYFQNSVNEDKIIINYGKCNNNNINKNLLNQKFFDRIFNYFTIDLDIIDMPQYNSNSHCPVRNISFSCHQCNLCGYIDYFKSSSIISVDDGELVFICSECISTFV